MVGIEAFASATLAGMIYVLIPGPAMLAVLSLTSTQNRYASAKFLAAHLLGDVIWSLLALLAIVGVSKVGPQLFDYLGMACGAYLIWLGGNALFSRANIVVPIVTNPIRSGLIFGLSNPKSYPFALAMMTVILGKYGANLTVASAAVLLIGCTIGFILADLVAVYWTGLAFVRQGFSKHPKLITRLTGALFIAFGAKSLAGAAASLRSHS